ncbi:aminoglycoside 6-adenylyltransferase [Streptomyces somaliensis]|uniref:aminoglycoside 6-adenylyltransferase n=1 Tax=Streptomyces somaliensis TaxID=78355 RepID=UPI0020CC4A03|nr:aminoglycoside 6-adenylyltransferase [Streptomyces somaliensis]MCP9945971.1 aminoglycoside 6-adenylyltransferase [Streptomyces somaliensis]MCP9960858.1 aminoglycoside 6-adenylyltransferase [Streptomyces somaliensis]MCP9973643.1 aminoglycoside 6-adenylyltransferase [Streptomyces somaliensis]
MDYTAALAALVEWAESAPAVRALVLTGSAAQATEDRLSDRDVQVFTSNTAVLLEDESWWRRLGEVLVVERLEDGEGNPTRLVYYVGGKFDFSLLPAEKLGGRGYDRPYRVLLDKDGLAATTALRPGRAEPPSAEEFDESVNWAWAAALMEARAIVRDEPWSARLRDQDLKEQLLEMIEWDHRARYGAAFDTHHLGARMRRWMDRDVQRALRRCWSGADPREAAQALLATVELYVELAGRTAVRYGFPVFDHERVGAELRSVLDELR